MTPDTDVRQSLTGLRDSRVDQHDTMTAWDVVRLALGAAEVLVAEAGLDEVTAVTALLDEHAAVVSVGPRHGHGPAIAIDVDPAFVLRQAQAGVAATGLALDGVIDSARCAVTALTDAYHSRAGDLEQVRRIFLDGGTTDATTKETC